MKGLVAAAVMVLAGTVSAREEASKGVPSVRVGRRVDAPSWARNQLEGLAAWERALEACLEKFVDEKTGTTCARFHHGTADDVAEAFAVWDHFIAIRGTLRLKRAYVRICEALYEEMKQRRIFTKGFYRGDYDATAELGLASERSRAFYKGGYDAEHAGELLQFFYGALEMDPTNPTLVEAVRGVADVMMGPCYNPKTRLLRHEVLSSSGGMGEPYDTVNNTIFMLAGWYAYLATGNEKYRTWVLEYTESWNQLADANGGVFPCTANSNTREIPPAWWTGGFFPYRGSVMVAVRGIHGWAPAVAFLDPKRMKSSLRGVNGLLDALFSAQGGGLPANFVRDGTWKRSGSPYGIVKLADRPYVLTFDDAAAKRLRTYYQKADGTEKRFLQWANFTYFGGEDLKFVAGLFANRKASGERLRQRVQALTADPLPKSGDGIANYTKKVGLEQAFVDGAFWGMYDNGRAGGAVTASVRYWRTDGRFGLPDGVAALVRHVAKDRVRVLLYNNNENPAAVRLTAGYYGQHRFDAVSLGDGKEAKVGDRRLDVALPGKSLAQLDLGLTRYAYRPTLQPLAPATAGPPLEGTDS